MRKKNVDTIKTLWYNKKKQQRKEVPKMTKKEMFMEIRNAVLSNEEMVTFIDHEIELLERKANSPRKPTKTQIENNNFKALVIEYLISADAPKNLTDIKNNIEPLQELTVNRIARLCNDLVNAGRLNKEYIKKTPFYSFAA